MARPSLLSLLSVLILFHGSCCLARTTQFQFQNECQLNRLDSVRPSHRAQHEAGLTEFWDPNHEQFQCAGVALMRNTIQPQGLLLPQFSNAPQLIYIEQGRGYTGIVMPGCPETFQDPQQGATGRRGSAGAGASRDQHQKLRRFRQGDIIAIPAGVVHWCYNDGDEPVVAVALVDTSNHQNQLDRNPRKFHLAGNPEEEMRQMRRMQEEGTRLRRGEGREQEEYQPGAGGRGSQSRCNNLFCGFDTEILAEALNIDRQTARRLQGENDGRGSIIRVRERLEFVRPPTMEEEEQERGDRRYDLTAVETENGLEETFCSMKLCENIERPERADIYNPNAGRISTINSHTLPILRSLRLSAERVVLYKNAGVVPNWCMNANKVLYMIRGRCRMQVVNEAGEQVFNGDVERGQVLVIPANHAVVKRAQSEGAEWITFNTNDNAMTNTLSGRTSALRAMPEDVLANSFRISRDEARRLKFANEDTYFSTASRSPMRMEA